MRLYCKRSNSPNEANSCPARRYRSTSVLSLEISNEISAKEFTTCWKAEASTARVLWRIWIAAEMKLTTSATALTVELSEAHCSSDIHHLLQRALFGGTVRARPTTLAIARGRVTRVRRPRD